MSTALMNTYARADLAFERGEGAYLYATDGRRYLDFCSGIAVTSLGHNHPHLVGALKDQANKVWHLANLVRIPEGEMLAERLVAHSFADKVFFCNSGVEAFEAAAKLTRKYFDHKGQPDRHKIITCSGAFHGRSLSAIAAAGNPKYLEGFAPHAPGYTSVAFGNLNEVRMAVDDETAAIMVEPVQGEGGIRPADSAFLKGLRVVCKEFGLLLIYDEIQCGIGRTGNLFAYQEAGVAPDIMMLAKGLGGGFPVGAVLATEEVAEAFVPGNHGTTFGGNPLAMACGNAVMDVMTGEGFLENVQVTAEKLTGQLNALVEAHSDTFVECRGAGLMLGLRCAEGVSNVEVVNLAREMGLLTVGAAENVVRILPPLIINDAHIAEAITILGQVADHLEAK